VHTALIFKEQAKEKEPGLREKSLAQPNYSIQQIEGYDLLCHKLKRFYYPIIEMDDKKDYPATINIYFIQDRQEQKRLSGIL
jgi:hypothetical protein